QLQLYITEYYRKHNEMDLADLLTMIPEEPLRKILLELEGWEMLSSEYSKTILVDSMERIKRLSAQQKMEILKEKAKYVSKEEQLKILQNYSALADSNRKRGSENGKGEKN
ncbi:MAG: hypothetical protein IIZ48_02905, partial [Erysipelotrichales bacterium]|nr:hypothetical protein [Erysipelotrichales bacterium]